MTKFFPATLDKIPVMLTWVRGELQAEHLPSATIRKLELITEEAVANVILHSYRESPGEIEIGIQKTAKGMQMHIRDWGPFYNPLLHAPHIDLEAPLAEREAGGLGIHLMKQLVDEISYCRDVETNLLTFIVKSPSPQES
ncbi:MAG: ATP-binding protein [Verrucomicrobiota bacterium]|nr:ATP-binding protein [Verrucomicrobiota bacterium]